MCFSKVFRLVLGGILCTCLSFNLANANKSNINSKTIIDLQQGELTATEALNKETPALLVRGVPVSIASTNNIRQGSPKLDLSKREKKEAKLAARARKNAEKARLKAEKEKAKKKNKQEKRKTTGVNSLEERINAILAESAKKEPVPLVIDYGSAGILGEPVVSKEQALRFLLNNNPNPKLSVSPEEIVDLYYEEATREGVRPDAAFAQALKETGFFNYGGTVTPDQNNYCGLGTTSATVKGAYFSTAREGVRAHIQHLLAYATVRPPRTDIVDPRYMLVRAAYGVTTIDTWPGLNGRWAVPGNNYGESIMDMVSKMASL